MFDEQEFSTKTGIMPRRLIAPLLLCTLLTTGVVVIMFALGVPLGEPGKMVYRYSSLWLLRMGRCWPVVIAAALLVLAGRQLSNQRHGGLPLGFLGLLILCGWTWYIPPKPSVQQVFNLMSPSQDGAFMLEADKVGPMPYYLSHFPAYLKRLPENVLGTRVLSNPPGMTILAVLMRDSVTGPPFSGLAGHLAGSDFTASQMQTIVARLRMSFLLIAMLALSGVFAYLLGREFLSPVGAGLMAVLITINPATAAFSPGKDPAQLLTINIMLWAWFASARRRHLLFGFIAGAALVVGSTIGLIHIWIALAALAATLWKFMADRSDSGAHLSRRILSAIVGAAAVCLAGQLSVGWNIPGTLVDVAIRFRQIQHTIHYTRWIWWIIGLPLFWLFLSPVIPALALLKWKRRTFNHGANVAARTESRLPERQPSSVIRSNGDGTAIAVANRRSTTAPAANARWGGVILVSTVAVMLLTYVIGVTYELPRLWIAFLPLLTLGVCADLPLLRCPARRRALNIIILLLLVHLATTAIHSSLLDARGSEYRLMQAKFFH